MKVRKITASTLIALMTLSCPIASLASRMEPKKVSPVSYRGVVYRVNHEKMGFLEAWDEKTGKLLWEKRIYRVFYNPFLERDVQDVYINGLEIAGDSLIIQNEKKKRFRLDIKTGSVTPAD